MTIRQALTYATKKLLKAKSTSPTLDAEVLLSHVLDKTKEYLFSNPNEIISNKLEKQFTILLNRRLIGWPVAYTINHKEFFGLDFYVDKNVLIPRPETEGLVELILTSVKKKFANKKPVKILDIGTGSGNIIISLAKKSPTPTKLFASDISDKSLMVAKKNAKNHSVKVIFKQGSLLEPWATQTFDIIVANLPYLPKLTNVSTKHEPIGALIAAKKGLKLIEELITQLAARSRVTQVIFLEIGHDQGPAIKKLVAKLLPGYKLELKKDLFRKDRYIVLTKNPA